jgi:hypothetical protein
MGRRMLLLLRWGGSDDDDAETGVDYERACSGCRTCSLLSFKKGLQGCVLLGVKIG